MNFPLKGGPLPPPLDPECIPGPQEAFWYFMLGYLLFIMCVLWILPRRWTTWAFPRRDERQ